MTTQAKLTDTQTTVLKAAAHDEIELLHGIGDQFVEPETLAVQHLVGGLQRRQLEQLLRQAAYLVALRQRRGQQASAPPRFGGCLAGHRFEMAVQRRQGRPQIVRDAGHHLAVRACLLLFARRLRLDTLRHLGKGRGNGADFVAAGRRAVAPGVGGVQRPQRVVAHAASQAMQGQRQAGGEGAGSDHAGVSSKR